MIEDCINKLEFPVYEAIPKNDFIYYRRKGMLKMMVDAANSYRNTPPCPMPKSGEVIPCATLRLKKSLRHIIKR